MFMLYSPQAVNHHGRKDIKKAEEKAKAKEIAEKFKMKICIGLKAEENLVTSSESWAITLSFSTVEVFLKATNMIIISCQFNRSKNEIRLNTGSGYQKDQSSFLGHPLDYSQYLGNGPQHNNATQFVLEHSFCGRKAEGEVDYKPVGCGFLKIIRHPNKVLEDHRVYGEKMKFTPPPTPPEYRPLKSLGLSIASVGTIGKMRSRVRSFEIWENKP